MQNIKFSFNRLKLILLFLVISLWPGGFVNAADYYNGNDPVNWAELIANATGTTHIVSTDDDFKQKVALVRPGDVILGKV